MATNFVFQNSTLESGKPSTYAYLFNDFLMRTGGLINVIDAITSDPPGSPVVGDAYIVGTSATGAWATHEKDIAIWYGNIWNFIVPKVGMVVHNLAIFSDMEYSARLSWFSPDSQLNVGSKGTGTWTVSEILTNANLYFTFSGSTPNVTITSSNTLYTIPGRVYSITGANTTGTTATLTLATGVWLNDTNTFVVVNNSRVHIQFAAMTSSRIIILKSVFGLVNI
jgi:hypothetical protein